MAQDIPLLKALSAKMNYLSQRQAVIAQNVSNADTPGYKPRDLAPADFGSVLGKLDKGQGVGPVRLASTNEKHMPAPGVIQNGKIEIMKDAYEISPTGNAVVIEQQMMMAGQNSMDYNLVTGLYQKQIGLLKTAVGGG